MVFAEDIRKMILKLAEERGTEKSFAPFEVAFRVNRETSEEIIEQVYFVASVLIREGKITSIPIEEAKNDNSARALRFRKAQRA